MGERRWAAISRDTKILERPEEISAYRAAKLHMFLFPGQATRMELLESIDQRLADVCMLSNRSRPGVWRMTRDHGRWMITEL